MNDISVPAPVHQMPVEIVKSIQGIMREVRKLGKEGTNTFQRYNYTSVDQFYEALGPLMAAHGLCDMAFERSMNVEMRETTNDRGETKKGVWMTAQYDFVLYHESGVCSMPIARTITVQATGPQSYASAQSFAEKYFLRNLFKVPTGDVDEVDSSDKQGLPTGNVVDMRADKKITATQVQMIQTALNTLTDKGVEAAMLAALNVAYISEIPASKVEKIMSQLASKLHEQSKAVVPMTAREEQVERIEAMIDAPSPR